MIVPVLPIDDDRWWRRDIARGSSIHDRFVMDALGTRGAPVLAQAQPGHDPGSASENRSAWHRSRRSRATRRPLLLDASGRLSLTRSGNVVRRATALEA